MGTGDGAVPPSPALRPTPHKGMDGGLLGAGGADGKRALPPISKLLGGLRQTPSRGR